MRNKLGIIDLRKNRNGPLISIDYSQQSFSESKKHLNKIHRARKFIGSLVIEKTSRLYQDTHSGTKSYKDFDLPG